MVLRSFPFPTSMFEKIPAFFLCLRSYLPSRWKSEADESLHRKMRWNTFSSKLPKQGFHIIIATLWDTCVSAFREILLARPVGSEISSKISKNLQISSETSETSFTCFETPMHLCPKSHYTITPSNSEILVVYCVF